MTFEDFNLIDCFRLYNSCSQYRPRDIPKWIFLLSFPNICVHVHVQKMKFQRNCSLDYHHVVCIGRWRDALWGICLLFCFLLIYAYVCTCRRWNFKGTVLCVVCIKKAMYKLKSSIPKGYWVVLFFLTQFKMKCCSMLFLSNRNHRPVCLIWPLQMTSLIVPNGKSAWRPL